MPHPPLDNLGLMHKCGNHWRLEHGGVMGVRGDNTDGNRWMRECAIVAEDLGTKFMYHPMTGYAAYIALSIELHGPLRLLADRVIVWLGRLTHGGYSAAVILTLHRDSQEKPQLIHLDQAELAGLAIQRAQVALAEQGLDGESYTQAFHDAGNELFETWWGYRLNAMAQLAIMAKDWAARYPHPPTL